MLVGKAGWETDLTALTDAAAAYARSAAGAWSAGGGGSGAGGGASGADASDEDDESTSSSAAAAATAAEDQKNLDDAIAQLMQSVSGNARGSSYDNNAVNVANAADDLSGLDGSKESEFSLDPRNINAAFKGPGRK